jgi:predicted metal-binding protein
MNSYECEGCGAIFNGTAEQAFEEGWDTPERFVSHCTCGNCTIDKTVWWKVVVLKQPITAEEEDRLVLYNKIYEEAKSAL